MTHKRSRMIRRRVLWLAGVGTAKQMKVVAAVSPSYEGMQRRWFRYSPIGRSSESIGIGSDPSAGILSVPASPTQGKAADAIDGVLNDHLSQLGSSAANTSVEMRGRIYDTSSVEVQNELYPPSAPWDPRTSAMQALDKMISENLMGVRVRGFRPWICVNSGTSRSGKTKVLELSCNRFVSSESDAIFKETDLRLTKPRPRHAIFITMNGSGIDDSIDENSSATIRLYHRILFAIRENRTQTWTQFMREVRRGTFGDIDAATVVREIRNSKDLKDAHVLIAADELRKLAPINVTPRTPHGHAKECMHGLTALNELVRLACKRHGEAHIFLVASALSVVDLKVFATGSSSPFTFQPLEPVEPVVLRDMFEKVGIKVDHRRLSEEDLCIATGILKHSTAMRIMMDIQSFDSVAARRARVAATIKALNEEKPVTSYLYGVHGNVLNSAEKLKTVYELLRSLFTAHPPGGANGSFCTDLYPALDAMCYDVCRVIRKGGKDTVLMRPDIMEELCDEFLRTPAELRTREQSAFVTAVGELAQALTEAVAVPGIANAEVRAAQNLVQKVRSIASSPSGVVALGRLATTLEGVGDLTGFAKKLTAFIASKPGDAESDLTEVVKMVAASQQDTAVVQESITTITTVANPSAETLSLVELSSLLTALAASMSAGKTFERLIKCLFRCVLLSDRKVKLTNLFELPPDSKWESAVFARTRGQCPDVLSITAFPRAYDATINRSNECDPAELQLLRAAGSGEGKSTLPCVFQPKHPYNLLLDVAVLAELTSGEILCLGLQCKEYSASLASRQGLNDTDATWRNRDRHLECNGPTKDLIDQFTKEVKILWVLVAMNNPVMRASDKSSGSRTESMDRSPGCESQAEGTPIPAHTQVLKPHGSSPNQDPSKSATGSADFTLMADEALLSLDAARRWCPSLQFVSSASAVWTPGGSSNPRSGVVPQGGGAPVHENK